MTSPAKPAANSRLKEGFAYLDLMTDAYSKRIVGYDLNTTLERDGALCALRMAIDHTP